MDKFVIKRPAVDQPANPIPAKRPAIPVLPIIPKILENTERDNSPVTDLGKESPYQPVLSSFPKDDKGRCFRREWYDQFKWLEYSVQENKAFCFPCRVYSTKTGRYCSNFQKKGFCNWRKALDNDHGFKQHDSSDDHQLSFLRWQSRISITENKTPSIENILDPNRQSAVSEHREYFALLIKYHIYFLTNEMPYRKNDETDESLFLGKWKEFIKCSLDTNERFRDLQQKVTGKHKKYDYTSKRTCGEMVSVISELVRESIVSEINEAGIYSIMIDECKDNAGHEELSICFRYVKDGEIVERFYCLRRIPEADASHLVESHIKPVLSAAKITALLIGGGADGASVMSGAYEGVFAKLQVSYPYMIYIHCAAHRLNLVISSFITHSTEAKKVVALYKSLHTILNVANNKEIFEEEQLKLFPKKPVKSISQLTEVRWSCKFEGIDTVIKCIKPLLISLQRIAAGSSNKADTAAGAYHKMLSSSFITSLVFIHEVLAITDGFNRLLQETTVDWVTARHQFEICKTLLTNINLSDIAEKVSGICLDVDITCDYEDPVHATRKTLSDYFRMNKSEGKKSISDILETMKKKTNTKILKDLDHRFNSMSSVLVSSIYSLDAASDTYLDFNAMQPLVKHYDSLDINETLLKSECQRAKITVTSGNSFVPRIYPNLQRLFQINKTLPVSTATVERGFSCMRRIISYVRNSLTSDNASDFMLTSLNKDLLVDLDIDKIIDRWASQKKRHVQLH